MTSIKTTLFNDFNVDLSVQNFMIYCKALHKTDYFKNVIFDKIENQIKLNICSYIIC